jgi:probable phosphoglycerate mutase
LTNFILVRHGQTGWNKQERFRGWVDVDLDDEGIKQAKAAAQRVVRWQVDAVYSSPLKRAMSTAQVIAKHFNVPVTPLDGITDMNFGDWQGLAIQEAREKFPEQFDFWLNSPHRLQIPGGETLEDVRRRAVATIEELAARHEDDTIAVVTHRVVCKVLLLSLLGLNNSHFWQIAQDTTAVNAFEIYEGRTAVTLINDTCHLEGQ